MQKSKPSGYDHITFNAPDPIRTPKLKDVEPAQYWGGGPPGNSVVLYPLFFFLNVLYVGVCCCFFSFALAVYLRRGSGVHVGSNEFHAGLHTVVHAVHTGLTWGGAQMGLI